MANAKYPVPELPTQSPPVPREYEAALTYQLGALKLPINTASVVHRDDTQGGTNGRDYFTIPRINDGPGVFAVELNTAAIQGAGVQLQSAVKAVDWEKVAHNIGFASERFVIGATPDNLPGQGVFTAKSMPTAVPGR